MLRRLAVLVANLTLAVAGTEVSLHLHSLAVANQVMSEIPGTLYVSQLLPRDLVPFLPEGALPPAREHYFFEDFHPRASVYAAAAAHLRQVLIEQALVPPPG